MELLLGWAAANALSAAALAVLAFVVSAIWRKPALAHTLWLLVLIKLATPPLWDAPIPAEWLKSAPVGLTLNPNADFDCDVSADLDPSRPTVMAAVESNRNEARRSEVVVDASELIEAEILELEERIEQAEWERDSGAFVSVVDDQATRATATVAAAESTGAEAAGAPSAAWRWLRARIAAHWAQALAIVWLGGSLFWLIRAAVRIVRFERTLKLSAWRDESVQRRADELARLMGLRRAPMVWMVPGPVSPMLWWTGFATRLILPSALWERLDSDRQDALLVHELAHRRRRDHWARVIELAAAGLHWWNPVAWWARARLRSAEEQCCDAWVVWTLPKSEKTYAYALLDALDFLAEGEASARTAGRGCGLGWRLAALRSSPSLPAAATGLGQFSDLSQRITLIMRGNTSKAMSWAGKAFVLSLCGLLPFTPTVAQDAAKTVPGVGLIEVSPNIDIRPFETKLNFKVVELDDIAPQIKAIEVPGVELKAIQVPGVDLKAIEVPGVDLATVFEVALADDDDDDKAGKKEKKDEAKDKEKEKAKDQPKLSDEDKKKVEAEIAKARAEMEKAQKELQAAARKLAELHQKMGKPGNFRTETRVVTLGGPDGKLRTLAPGAITVEGRKIDIAKLAPGVIKPGVKIMVEGKEVEIKDGVAKIEGKDGEKKEIRVEVRGEGAAAKALGDQVRARVLRRMGDDKKAVEDVIIAVPAVPPAPAAAPAPPAAPAKPADVIAPRMARVRVLPPGAAPAPAIAPDADRRLRELEAKLNRVLEQLEKIQADRPGR